MQYSSAGPAISGHISTFFSNTPRDLLAGIVVALALIPEAIAFSIIAGVDPQVGLFASFTMAVTIAFLGGRPGMVSAATGAMALLMVDLVKDHGLQYLLAATLLTGVLQLCWGFLKAGRIMKYVPRAVLIGFVNALAILIFGAQLSQFTDQGFTMYAMVAGGLAIIYILPRITTLIPSPLVAIVALTAITMTPRIVLPTVGDMGTLPGSLPVFGIPDVPFTFATLQIILPTALTLSAVGLLESFLTASVVDEMTDTNSNKNKEARGQGIANIITGFFGGMAGCAMIGQSVINVKSGGRQRLSTLAAGVFLLFFILVMREWVSIIPMAALVAVMFMVSISTFDWSSITSMKKTPKSESAVMVATVATTVITHNLALGVGVGIALSAIAFSRKIAKLISVESSLSDDGLTRKYVVEGQLFFVSANHFRDACDTHEKVENVVIDLTLSHLWDQSAVMAVDRVVLKFREHGSNVTVIGMNEASTTLVERIGVHDKPDAELALH